MPDVEFNIVFEMFIKSQESEISNKRFFLYTWRDYFEPEGINESIQKFETLYNEYTTHKNKMLEMIKNPLPTEIAMLQAGEFITEYSNTTELYSKMTEIVTNEFRNLFKIS